MLTSSNNNIMKIPFHSPEIFKFRQLRLILLLIILPSVITGVFPTLFKGSALTLRAQTVKSELSKLAPKKLLKKGISVTGAITGNHVYYDATGIPNRTVPVNIMYAGNLTVDILGKIKMPVSFSLSNQSINWAAFRFSHPFDQNYQFRQPFNRLLLKPTYKGFTLHIGTAAMTFSPFTLAGHRFEGLGLEYKNPKKPFYAGVMVGNLMRAVRIDSTFNTVNNVPSYKRTGFGFQLGYKKKEDLAEIIFFTAKDYLNSLPYNLDDKAILPMQNEVVAFKGSKLIQKKILFSTELAFSAITNDIRAGEKTTPNNLFQTFFGTFSPKTSTDFRKAFKAELLYRGKTFNTGIKYSRIDPNYRTLGAYYFVNDIETIEAKLATQLLQGKLTFNTNIGIQQNNVLKKDLKTTRRTVGMLNVNYIPSEKINVMFNYSNFTNYSNIRSNYVYLTRVTPYNALDTLNFRQINQNLMLTASYVLPSKTKDISKTLMLNAIMQKGEQSIGSTDIKNDLTNLSLDYAYNLIPKKLMLSTSFNYSQSYFNNLPMSQWGPAFSFNKALGDKWRVNASLLYNWGKTEGVSQNGGENLSSRDKTFNARCGLTGKVSNKVNVLFNLIYLDRKATATQRQIPNFHEFTATLGLSYNFTVLKLQGK